MSASRPEIPQDFRRAQLSSFALKNPLGFSMPASQRLHLRFGRRFGKMLG